MLRNVQIKTQVVLGLGFLIALLTMIGGLAFYGVRNTAAQLQSITLKDVKAAGQVENIRFRMEINRSQILQSLQHNPTMEWSKLHDHPLDIHSKIVSDTTGEINAAWTRYMANITSPDEKKLAEEWFTASGRLGTEAIGKSMLAIRENRWDDAQAVLIRSINPTYRIGDGVLAKLTDLLEKRAARNGVKVEADISQTENTLAIVIVLAALLAIAVGILLVRSITVPLNQSIEIARRVAQGDLTGEIDVTSNNEIGQLLLALKNMNTSLATIIHNVRSATGMIGSASSEIATGNLDLSSRTEQQASSLEETASSMEELTSTVKQNSDNANEANQLALSASTVATKGGTVVSEVIATMASINESALKIVDIIEVIDGIAFQTNILALNAAVEAARAGEQGRGFAVVASEVRSLAQRSANAAKEIKALIDDSVEKVGVGTRLVDQAGVTMEEIVSSVRRVTDIMGEIAAASEEQTIGIGQVNQAITQMDEMTQQNAALVEQAAAAAAALDDQAKNLTGVISVFKVDNNQGDSLPLVPQQKEPRPALRIVPKKIPNTRIGKIAASRKSVV
ncbi:methyl-accepting chemotaxis protein [Noviherbaspirillum saxi]|uniref:HAMP domain-containing protein n=1 Tax=Noviherbaspirillum saxi TaxID=2320863 RepID=A0A3A3FUJ5_9BURK|nr:methyl-accepting chemotaxis protein [Noviherbaspirillum saxi]RJF98954.1 HAMP domain-containing protein [Noviherbaspirillum saxi]